MTARCAALVLVLAASGCSFTKESRRYVVVAGDRVKIRCSAIVDQNSCGVLLKDCVGPDGRYVQVHCATNVMEEGTDQ